MLNLQGRSPQSLDQIPVPLANRLLIGWALFRLPLILLVLYGFRQNLLAGIESVIGVDSITQRAIALISTLPERLLIFGISSLVLAAGWYGCQRLRSPGLRWAMPVAIALGWFLLLFANFASHNASLGALFLAGLFALNTLPVLNLRLPQGRIARIGQQFGLRDLGLGPGQRGANWLFGLLPGIAEGLLPRPFALWVLGLWHQDVVRTGRGAGLWAWLPVLPAIALSAVAVLMLPSPPLVELGYRLHADSAVQILDRGDLNMLAINQRRRRLYASGHGLKYLRVYNLDHLEQPPLQANTAIDYAQGFAYDARDDRLYFYHKASQRLLMMDGTSLDLLKSIATPPVSPGDVWVTWDPLTRTVSIASEADYAIGTPFVVINPQTAKVTHTSNLSPSYVYRSPDKPRLYMNFFRRTPDLIVYDPQGNRVLKQVPTDPQVDRMALVPARNELLVASPVNAQVLRYDADSLARRGAIPTSFGVRSVAVDAKRNLLLTGSLATNMLEVIDLNTFQRRAVYRLGPWLREICLDTEAGMAYVSANGALYKVDYIARL